MCYAIPGRIVEIRGNCAVVNYFGEHRNVLNEFADARVGDYVYAQGGIIVEKIAAPAALPILREWKKAFFRLKKLDSRLSGRPEKLGHDKKFQSVLQKAENGTPLGKRDVQQLLSAEGNEEKLLLAAANNLRRKQLKNSCCVHGIIEFSNHCLNNCSYCGIRAGNKKLARYRMQPGEIIEVATDAVKRLGFRALVLQSGTDPFYSSEMLCEIIRGIRERCGVLLFMSIGDRERECYKKMYAAGARGVLLRFETSNPGIYEKIHSGPKSSFRKRIELIKYAGRLGYIIATGSLIGLPNQRKADLARDISLAKELGAEMYSFGPFIPHPETPLAGTKKVDVNAVLRFIAAARLADPDAKILVTTALETLNREKGARLGLLAGANSLMINITPLKYRRLYSIYPDRAGEEKEAEESIKQALELLYSLGRAPTDLGVKMRDA